MSRLLAACILATVVFGAAAFAVPSPAPRPIALVLDDAAPATRAKVAAGVAALGGRVVHTFDDVLVVLLPGGNEFSAYRLPGVREVALNAVNPGSRRAAALSAGLAAWNGIAGEPKTMHRTGPVDEPMAHDALVPPPVSLDAVRAASRMTSSVPRDGARLQEPAVIAATGAPFGATELNTSEFLAGAVSVNVILVESDGKIDPSTENWSASREGEVVARIAAGLEWVRTQEPQAALQFVYHVIAGRTDARARTGYEPIRHAADPNGSTGEDLWTKEVLARFGYTTGDRFARSRALASDTRRADGTDWAVNIFVVDSLVDGDGKFSDGRFAYCWIGGPHLIMTYDNGAWGSGRMDMVLRHELLHAFYAFDEYSGSSCTCTEHRGYLDGANENCETCNAVAGACVMIANGDAMCGATRRNLGWADLDGDGTIDVVGEDPDTFFDAMPADVCTAPVLTGLASVVAATDRNTFVGVPHPSISINRIAGVEVRADEAPWVMAESQDGTWGMPQQRFRLAFPDLPVGAHRFEARAIDNFGNTDQEPGVVQIIVQPDVSPLGDSVRADRKDAGVAMSWDACAGANMYRVYRRSSPGAADTAVAETASTSWADPSPATGYYTVRPVNACGDERPD
jgi:hypothetical protein